MNQCLYCHTTIQDRVSWSTLFQTEKKRLCIDCAEQLVSTKPPWCKQCSRPLKESRVCSDCARWERSSAWSNKIRINRSLYHYNDWMKELIAQFKYRGDNVLAEVFSRPLIDAYEREFRGCLVVPIPLSDERMKERGFNQTEELASFFPNGYSSVLSRVLHEDKMSKQGRGSRLRGSARPFAVIEGEVVGRHVLLIDDLYTTGSTVRKAAIPLIEAGAVSVSSLTIARS